MDCLVICAVAFTASLLTFFSGFGLVRFFSPPLAVFFPVERAIALTAVVHFLNGLFKLVLVRRFADVGVVVRFGLPAIVSAIAGAWLLLRLSEAPPVLTYTMLGHPLSVTPVNLVVGLLLLLLSGFELVPRWRSMEFSPRYLPLGGLLSGFFGGLAGMQGALRSAFLIKTGLTKEGFIATGAAVAFLIDISRIGVYGRAIVEHREAFDYGLLTAAVVAALAGAVLGNRFLRKVTMGKIQSMAGLLLVLVSMGLITGIL